MPIVSSAAELILTEYILITIRNTYFVSPFSFSEKNKLRRPPRRRTECGNRNKLSATVKAAPYPHQLYNKNRRRFSAIFFLLKFKNLFRKIKPTQ